MKKNNEELKEKCTCMEEEGTCTCGDECTCGDDCTCNDNCSCEADCNCGEECSCGETCECGDECSCNENTSLVEDLNKEINSLKEMLLRNQAELQNYKRRKDEEARMMEKYKYEDLIKELLAVVDNFERAIKMDDNDLADEVSKFLAGFKLIYTNTVNILNKFEVTEIKAEGTEFDPEYHHAVLTEHDENRPANVVLEVLQKGYTYKDRVIRPAMVKVND